MTDSKSDELAQVLDLQCIGIAGKPQNTYWNMICRDGVINTIDEVHDNAAVKDSQFLIPSLCHPHIHLDKAFLLSHPKYEDLVIERGDFAEAISLTSKAKARFEHSDLIERGRALIEESVNFGVTHMRAFVEVDQEVGLKCLEAGLELKEEFRARCYIQICVFAQDPIFSYEDGGEAMTRLLELALSRNGVEALGSTPYVEQDSDFDTQIRNMKWTIATALKFCLHLDFHIDYNIDPSRPSLIPALVDLLHDMHWPSNPKSTDFRTIVLGHCTRLTLFGREELLDLRKKLKELPVFFVGLPTSDLFMMGRPDEDSDGGSRVRGTLQIPQMIQKYGFNAAIGINNVGNAFTPHGSCDPLSLASFGVGVYQAGSKADVETLLQCVTSRAKAAIGLSLSRLYSGFPGVGEPAHFIIFQNMASSKPFRSRKTVRDIIYDAGNDRTTVYNGKVVSR